MVVELAPEPRVFVWLVPEPIVFVVPSVVARVAVPDEVMLFTETVPVAEPTVVVLPL